ncbi:MAG TPA: glucokinase [Casimicrobiaceae bacterium]|nr:glucokinase [Casimicrobiaceae bacterium]
MGGTHARFLLAEFAAARLVVVDEASFSVASYDSIETACEAFVARSPVVHVDRACLAVAGPVEGRRARLTNAPWTIDADVFAARFSIGDVRLCNDFEAAAYAIDALDASACIVLQAGQRDVTGPRVLIGAGTGLGVAYLLKEAGATRVVAGEGGHAGFAPADAEQIELVRFLAPSLGRVTAEHVLSGPGLVRLYAFANRDRASLPEDVRAEGAAAVAQRFAAAEPEAVHAVQLFASILSAVAGDHALAMLATGGVYIAGGIAPRFAGALRERFVRAFAAEGPHAQLMARIPVTLVTEPRLGLIGAARRAAGA